MVIYLPNSLEKGVGSGVVAVKKTQSMSYTLENGYNVRLSDGSHLGSNL